MMYGHDKPPLRVALRLEQMAVQQLQADHCVREWPQEEHPVRPVRPLHRLRGRLELGGDATSDGVRGYRRASPLLLGAPVDEGAVDGEERERGAELLLGRLHGGCTCLAVLGGERCVHVVEFVLDVAVIWGSGDGFCISVLWRCVVDGVRR